MKLKDILSQYTIDTTKASDICRQSNYSLIAVCWILAKESVDNLVNYKIVLFFVVLSLYFDFIQYFYRGVMEGKHFDEQEAKAKDDKGIIDEQYDAMPYPVSLKTISTGLYYTKIACTFIAFLLLLWLLFY